MSDSPVVNEEADIRDLVADIFPNLSREELGDLIWCRTGWPGFWKTEKPLEEIRASLLEYKGALESHPEGTVFCDFCCEPALEGQHLCPKCQEEQDRVLREVKCVCQENHERLMKSLRGGEE